jgi:hypothetical protein
MNWQLWIRQTLIITAMELKRYVLARRWVGVYLAAFAPVFLVAIAAMRSRSVPIGAYSVAYAVFFHTYALRLALFFCCALVFSQLFRGEVLEKTLHFYLLAPVRREVLAAGKYLAGVIAMAAIFGTSTIATNVLVYVPNPGWTSFFLEGDGIPYLSRYVLVTVMGCMAYGGVFLLAGLLFKNPAVPALVVAGWETFYFVLPKTLQKFTVMHYLQSILPVGIDLGPLAIEIDPTPAVLSIPALIVGAALLVWMSGLVLKRTQVTYSAD